LLSLGKGINGVKYLWETVVTTPEEQTLTHISLHFVDQTIETLFTMPASIQNLLLFWTPTFSSPRTHLTPGVEAVACFCLYFCTCTYLLALLPAPTYAQK